MKVGPYLSRWLAQILIAGALALALAPQPAYAHDGQDRTGAPVSQPADPAAGIAGTTNGWSPSCPGSPGSPCCCGRLTACAGDGKRAIVHAGGWIVPVQPFVRQVVSVSPGAAPLALSLPSLVLPRAPPFFS